MYPFSVYFLLGKITDMSIFQVAKLFLVVWKLKNMKLGDNCGAFMFKILYSDSYCCGVIRDLIREKKT